MSRTRLTKTGQPTMGTTIEVETTDKSRPNDPPGWETVTVVGGVTVGGHTLVMCILEFDDGSRLWAKPWSEIVWRAIR